MSSSANPKRVRLSLEQAINDDIEVIEVLESKRIDVEKVQDANIKEALVNGKQNSVHLFILRVQGSSDPQRAYSINSSASQKKEWVSMWKEKTVEKAKEVI